MRVINGRLRGRDGLWNVDISDGRIIAITPAAGRASGRVAARASTSTADQYPGSSADPASTGTAARAPTSPAGGTRANEPAANEPATDEPAANEPATASADTYEALLEPTLLRWRPAPEFLEE